MSDFWLDYVDESTGPALREPMIRQAETELGFRLPESYVALLQTRNGGYPRRNRFPFDAAAVGESDDPIQIERADLRHRIRGRDRRQASRQTSRSTLER